MIIREGKPSHKKDNMNKQRIRITAINENVIGWHGEMLERYMAETLSLRTARKVGDEEIVNHYQLGQLKKAKEYGGIDYIKL